MTGARQPMYDKSKATDAEGPLQIVCRLASL